MTKRPDPASLSGAKSVLTPERLDGIPQPSRRGDRIIWTLGAIGKRIGVGPDFVRDTLSKQPGSPVRKIGARYYAFEDELMAALRRGLISSN